MIHPLTQDLLEWYDQNQRVLPWRTIRTPYRTLVSEVMLQQTRVDTGIPYFETFLKTFPDVETLANAELDTVLAHWSGLGYYSRARNLHAAAQQVVELGMFPNNLTSIRALKGVGEYIAGAIASMAFNIDVAAVDGNLHRVLSRLYCHAGTRSDMWEIADQLLPKGSGRSGDFNQALMDLGSSHCSKKWSCDGCPIQTHCQAFKDGMVDQFPIVKKKKPKKVVHYWAVLLTSTKDGAPTYYLAQRPNKGLYGGMVEPFLYDKDELSTDFQSWLSTQEESLWQPIEIEWIVEWGKTTHILTHRKMMMDIIEVCIPEDRLQTDLLEQIAALKPTMYIGSQWYNSSELRTVGISTLTGKIMEQVNTGQLSLF